VGDAVSLMSTAPRASRLEARRLSRVLEYIDAHLEAELDLNALAAVACLSRFHFNRCFKATTGQAPNQYVGTQRMKRARQLLLEGRRPIADLALALGFSSQANFTRAFSREVGVSPGRYREQWGRSPLSEPADLHPAGLASSGSMALDAYGAAGNGAPPKMTLPSDLR